MITTIHAPIKQEAPETSTLCKYLVTGEIGCGVQAIGVHSSHADGNNKFCEGFASPDNATATAANATATAALKLSITAVALLTSGLVQQIGVKSLTTTNLPILPGMINGLSWAKYSGFFARRPVWFAGSTCTGSGKITSLNQSLSQTEGNDSYLLAGFFVAQTAGKHSFHLVSNGAAYLWTGPSALKPVSSLSPGDADNSVFAQLEVSQAFPLLIMYGQNNTAWDLELEFKMPGNDPLVDGSGYYYSSASSDALINSVPAVTVPGLKWARYDQGYFKDSPSWFQGLTASATGITNGWTDINQKPLSKSQGFLPIAQYIQFSFLISGTFVAQKSGIHTFQMSSDDASYMWIGPDALVDTSSALTSNAAIKAPGEHPNQGSSVAVDMVAGQAYPLRIMYGQNMGDWNLRFSYSTPDGGNTTDGTGHFFSVPS